MLDRRSADLTRRISTITPGLAHGAHDSAAPEEFKPIAVVAPCFRNSVGYNHKHISGKQRDDAPPECGDRRPHRDSTVMSFTTFVANRMIAVDAVIAVISSDIRIRSAYRSDLRLASDALLTGAEVIAFAPRCRIISKWVCRSYEPRWSSLTPKRVLFGEHGRTYATFTRAGRTIRR